MIGGPYRIVTEVPALEKAASAWKNYPEQVSHSSTTFEQEHLPLLPVTNGSLLASIHFDAEARNEVPLCATTFSRKECTTIDKTYLPLLVLSWMGFNQNTKRVIIFGPPCGVIRRISFHSYFYGPRPEPAEPPDWSHSTQPRSWDSFTYIDWELTAGYRIWITHIKVSIFQSREILRPFMVTLPLEPLSNHHWGYSPYRECMGPVTPTGSRLLHYECYYRQRWDKVYPPPPPPNPWSVSMPVACSCKFSRWLISAMDRERIYAPISLEGLVMWIDAANIHGPNRPTYPSKKAWQLWNSTLQKTLCCLQRGTPLLRTHLANGCIRHLYIKFGLTMMSTKSAKH